MHPCPFCACHVRPSEALCPHCGERLGGGRRSALSAVLLSLTIASCTGGSTKTTGETGSTTAEPLYGVTVTDTDTDTDADIDADTDADTDADSDADTDLTGDTGPTTGVDYGTAP